MNIIFDIEKIRELFINYYNISGLRLALFNADYRLLFDYPVELRPVCYNVRCCPSGEAHCRLSEHYGMAQAELSKDGYSLYNCHIGLQEACFTVVYNSQIVAYVFFGSLISDQGPSRERLLENCITLAKGMDNIDWKSAIDSTPCTPIAYVQSAIQIMRACINSIIYENMIKIKGDAIWNKIEHYVNENLGRKISLDDISREIYVSKSTISHKTKAVTGQSIGSYILHKKMDRASEYLCHTDYKINQVADLIGISDYNYFSRLFRKTFGISPSQFRNNHYRPSNK